MIRAASLQFRQGQSTIDEPADLGIPFHRMPGKRDIPVWVYLAQ